MPGARSGSAGTHGRHGSGACASASALGCQRLGAHRTSSGCPKNNLIKPRSAGAHLDPRRVLDALDPEMPLALAADTLAAMMRTALHRRRAGALSRSHAPRVPPVRGRRACRGVRGSWAEPNRGARRRAFATCTTLPCLSPVARLQPALLTVAGPAGAGTGADVGTLRVRNASVGCSLMTGVGVLGAAALPGSLPGARDRRLLTVSQPPANCDRPGVIERARARAS